MIRARLKAPECRVEQIGRQAVTREHHALVLPGIELYPLIAVEAGKELKKINALLPEDNALRERL